MVNVTMHKAKTELSKLVARAEAGEEVVISRAGKPAVKLVPAEQPAKPARKPGALKGAFTLPDSFFDPLPEEELRAWEGGGFDEEEPVFDGGSGTAKVAAGASPVSPEAMGYGILRHLQGKLPPDLFLEPLTEEELAMWEKAKLP